MTGPEWAHDVSKKEVYLRYFPRSTARLVILSVAGVRCCKAVESHRMGNGTREL